MNGLVTLTVTAEAQSTLRFASNLAGELHSEIATGQPQQVQFGVPDGVHQISANATDSVGNSSGLTAPFQVSNPPPSTPTFVLSSRRGQLPVVVAITGAKKGAATVSITGHDELAQLVPLDDNGAGTVTFTTALDGTYALVGRVTDPRQRTSPDGTLEILVDTDAPALKVNIDKKAAKNGSISFTVKSEAGAKITVASKTRKLRDSYDATDKASKHKVSVDDGKYTMTFRAVDEVGNRTERKYKVAVGDVT